MPFLTTTRQLFSELEATAGTSSDPLDKAHNYLTPTLSDIRVQTLEFSVDPERDNENSKYLNGDFSGDESIVGKIPSKVKIGIKGEAGYFKDGISAVHKFSPSRLFESCGCEKITVSDNVALSTIKYPIQYVYFPSITKSRSTITLADLAINETKTGIARECRGAIGNFKMSADGTGKPLTIEFDYSGSTDYGAAGTWEVSPTNTAKLAFDSANVSTIPAEKYVNTSITVTDLESLVSSTFCSPKLSFDAGIVLSTIDCQNTSSGIVSGMIDEMNPRLSITPMMQTLTEFDFWAGLTTGKKYSINIVVDTTVADVPPIRLFIPRAEMTTATNGEDGKKTTQEMTFRPLANISKTLPTLKFYDQADGSVDTFSFAGTSVIGNEQGAMWFLMFGEREAV